MAASKPSVKVPPFMVKKVRADQAADKKAGIKEGSKKDTTIDKSKGILGAEKKMGLHGGAKKGK